MKIELPIPGHYDPEKVGIVWRVPYQQRAQEAQAWARQHGISPASRDALRIGLVLIDVQNTFCLPDFELFVSGRSGMGAIEDNRRLCEFIYRNMALISRIVATQDTHHLMQIFHPIFLVDASGANPPANTMVSYQDLKEGRWIINPAVAESLGIDPLYGQRQLLHYARQLEQRQKYALTIWPYHAMLGGIGHALVSAVEEAIFFHSVARSSQPVLEIKGENPLTEHYSAIGPEVLEDPDGKLLAAKNDFLLRMVEDFDALIIAGQAKSHCVAWTVDDLLAQIHGQNPELAGKVYLLEDCSSPVVVPGVVDFTEAAGAAYARFAAAGMHLVQSTQRLAEWPGLELK